MTVSTTVEKTETVTAITNFMVQLRPPAGAEEGGGVDEVVTMTLKE